jgi:hypothetical protein
MSLGERSLQLSRGCFAGQVKERAGRCRDRYSVTGANVTTVENASAVYADVRLLARVAGGDRDVDAPIMGWAGQQAPQVCGTAVADDRARAARQNSSHFVCMAGGCCMAKEVDASVKGM